MNHEKIKKLSVRISKKNNFRENRAYTSLIRILLKSSWALFIVGATKIWNVGQDWIWVILWLVGLGQILTMIVDL